MYGNIVICTWKNYKTGQENRTSTLAVQNAPRLSV